MLLLWPFFAGLQAFKSARYRRKGCMCTLLKAWATEDCGTHSYIAENEEEDIHTHVKTATVYTATYTAIGATLKDTVQ